MNLVSILDRPQVLQALVKVAAQFAPGIPSKVNREAPRFIKTPEVWNLAIQSHKAKRAGQHYDLRLIDNKTGKAYSWALRNLPTAPGEKVLAKLQPTHTAGYATWEGEIESGYGAGTVKLFQHDKIEVLKSDLNHVLFNVYKSNGDTERYALINTGGDNWLYYNVTPTRKTRPEIPSAKVSFPKIKPTTIDPFNANQIIAPKVDGAANVFVLRKNKPIETYSYRPSRRGAIKLIDHTFRLPLYRETPPPELDKTVLMGEVFARKPNGKVQSVQRTGSVLLSNVWRSRELQKKTPLDYFVYDILKYKGKDVSQFPYEKKIELLNEVTNKTGLRMPIMAHTPDAKINLIKRISSGKYPLTHEGFVVYEKDKSVPIKAKFTKDFDAYLRNVYPGEGKLSQSMGRVSYSFTPKGPIIGRVGGGFKESLRKQIWEHPKQYRGKLMRIYAQDQLPSGALRMPQFLDFREMEKWKTK